ncbi:hypothetical protein G6539_32655, partial [Streptomyces albidoflavus]|nr:hypothetical protein [Streptomyces albidoflavus]
MSTADTAVRPPSVRTVPSQAVVALPRPGVCGPGLASLWRVLNAVDTARTVSRKAA